MQDVTKERWKYIGGSDIPVIMGLSPFKTRWQLLQEKAQIAESEFTGNKYTEYGNVLEPKIREYVNAQYTREYKEAMKMSADLRFHVDGWDEKYMEILEIKTTSQIHSSLEGYKYYLVQLLAYMAMFGAEYGKLAVYERPDDFSEEFDPERLTVYIVNIRDHEGTLQEIYYHLNRFREDLAKLKENPFLTEQELQPFEIVAVAEQVVALEQSLLAYKQLEKEAKAAREELFKAMSQYGIKTWTMNGGTKITLIPDSDDTVVSEFNEKKFKAEHPGLHALYLEDRLKPGKRGYVRISNGKA